MPLDPVKIARATAGGLSVVCATCEKYWRAVDQGLDRCLASQSCGSPLAGLTFPEYLGPLNDEGFRLYCFVCGGKSSHGVRVKGKLRVIGVCRDHLKLFQELAPRGKAPPKLSEELSTAGDQQDLEKLLEPPKKTLRGLLAEIACEDAEDTGS